MEKKMDNLEAYDKGFRDALVTYSWMKDGITYVGTCGATLKDSVRNFRRMYNYNPPEEDDEPS